MGILAMIFSVLVLGSLGKLTALPFLVVTSQQTPEGNWAQPSRPGFTLDGCPTSCGTVIFTYPFGIGSRCSLGPDFNLTCNDATQTPRLFLRDGITQVTDFGDPVWNSNLIWTSFSHSIPMKSGVNVYNLSLKPPGRSFHLYSVDLNITGCDLEVYSVEENAIRLICSTVCPDPEIAEMVAMHNCDGFGCCRVQVENYASTHQFKLVHNTKNTSTGSNQTSQLWDKISITTDGLKLSWDIGNQSACVACISDHAECGYNYAAGDPYMTSRNGYNCFCNDGYTGNPYIPHGCSNNDKGYNPIPSRADCNRWCDHGGVLKNSELEEVHIFSTHLIKILLFSHINECLEPNECKGICHNTKGRFRCTECPSKTKYDPLKMQCTKLKQQPLLLGIIIGLSSGFGVLLLSFSTVLLTRRWKKNVQKQLRKNYFWKNKGLLLQKLVSSDETANDKTTIFSLEELQKATNSFDPTRVIGHGGHGLVYKGMLSDQRLAAIKKSKVIEECEISQFINEVAVLTQINHRNIVKLFGCCLETEVPLLVYDYVSSGSLSEVLHADPNNGYSLSWGDYLRIALETAGALSYLHSSASISIFHRDVKSSNILLDVNYTAKVSDFGASRLVPIDQTHIVTNVQGTFGYLDPEYFHTRQLNEKSDVYSFGVVLVELLLRLKPVFTSESGTLQNFSNYFLQELKEGRITGIVDSQVLEEATEEEINSVASLAELCLRLHGEERPTMKQVEMELQNLLTKRVNSFQADPRNEEKMQQIPLTRRRARATRQSSAAELGERVDTRS
ncbi:hypothetical protein ACQ4PT_016881 [Festuca glaucescens]